MGTGYYMPTTTDESTWTAKADYNFTTNNFSGTGTITASEVTNGVDSLSVNSLNIMLNSYRLSKINSVVEYNLVNGISDEFVDQSGVNTGASSNQVYNVGEYYQPATSTNMTLISNTITASATIDKTRIVIFEEDVDSITLNTDLLAYVSADGTNYEIATLVDEGYYANSSVAYYQAASFNGSNYIGIPYDLTRTAGTISLWLKTTKASQGVCEFSSTNYLNASYCDRALFLSAGGVMEWYVYGSGGNTITGSKVVNDGNWHFVQGVYTTTSLSIYVDGLLDVTASFTINSASAMPYFNLGWGQSFGSSNYFTGSIEEVQIYNTALSSGTITALYNSGAGVYGTGTESGLVAAYHLNGTPNDYKGINNGTWSSTPAYTTGMIVSGTSAGKRILSAVVDVSSHSGTSVKWKVVTANNKSLKLHAVGLNWG